MGINFFLYFLHAIQYNISNRAHGHQKLIFFSPPNKQKIIQMRVIEGCLVGDCYIDMDIAGIRRICIRKRQAPNSNINQS